VIRGTGRRRAGEDNIRLRQRVANLTDDLAWCRSRLMAVTARCRALQAQAEIADGERMKAEQLVARQTAQLMERDSRIAELERLVQAASDDTVEMPVLSPKQLTAA
jgi:chromosome segregation ATPase